MAKNKQPKEAKTTDENKNIQIDKQDQIIEESPTLETHEKLVNKALNKPSVKAAYDALGEEFAQIENSIDASINEESEIPHKIQMLEDFRIQCPLAGRRDASMLMALKAGQEITDKHVIQHILNSDAKFITK